MADESENQSVPEGAAQAISQGKRHLVVRDYFNAVTVLAQGCGMLAEQYGDTADELAEPYLLYGRALLGLSREEQAVLGTGVPGQEEDEEDEEEGEEAGNDESGEPATDDKSEKQEKPEKNKEDSDAKVEDKEPVTETEKKDDKTADSKNEESKDSASIEKEPAPAASSSSNGEAATPSTSSVHNGTPRVNGAEQDEDTDLENEEDEDSNSNLQLAWEVLELAKLILLKRGEAGHKLLAEAYRLLGEVAMESGNETSALSDLNNCLNLLRNLEPADARSMAETHYQLGLAYALGNEFDSSIEQFQEATSLLETRIKELQDLTEHPKPEDDQFYTVEGEIKELKELLPEIKEKIADMRDFKAQACKQIIENIKSHVSGGSCSNGAGPSGASSSSAGSSTSTAAASDISHLVRKKRKTEDETEADSVGSPCKKPNVVSPGKPA